MKKLLVIFAFLGMSLTPASAQEEDQLIFNHLGIGVSVGTTALGINVSTVLTPYFGLRAGVNLWPILKLRSNLHLGSRIQNWEPGDIAKYAQELNEVLSEDEQVPMEMPEAMSMHIKPKLTAGHLLIDYYPFPHSSNFDLTTGFHLGTGTAIIVMKAVSCLLQHGIMPWRIPMLRRLLRGITCSP